MRKVIVAAVAVVGTLGATALLRSKPTALEASGSDAGNVKCSTSIQRVGAKSASSCPQGQCLCEDKTCSSVCE